MVRVFCELVAFSKPPRIENSPNENRLVCALCVSFLILQNYARIIFDRVTPNSNPNISAELNCCPQFYWR